MNTTPAAPIKYDTKKEALENRVAGKTLYKSRRWIATAMSPINRNDSPGYYSVRYFWN